MRPSDLLLDTHIVIWMAIDPDRIPLLLSEAIEGAERRFVSHVTALEVRLKHGKNPAAFPFSLRELEETMKEFSCTELPITYQYIYTMGQMTFLHADPFDRLMMAQARNRNICLATLDEKIVRTFQKHEAFQVFLKSE
jgi:PIN domain nuclease of toxin-antitoxin system